MKELCSSCALKFKKQFCGNGGVTLVELLVSIAILVIVVGPFLGSFYNATTNNIEAKDKTVASALAQEVMDKVKSYRLYSGSAANGSFVDIQPGYTVKYTVTPLDINTPRPDFADITLSISNDTLSVTGRNETAALLNNQFILKLQEQTPVVANGYTMQLSGSGINISQNFTSDDNIDIKILCNQSIGGAFAAKSDIPDFKLDVDGIDKLGNKRVNFYILNDGFGSVIINNLTNTPFSTYKDIPSNQTGEITTSLYKIEVVVEKGTKQIDNLISYVRK